MMIAHTREEDQCAGNVIVTAVELFGPQITALQLVYADDRGHWPWDMGGRGGRGGQPVLGARARQRAA